MKNNKKSNWALFGILLMGWLLLILAPAGICYLIDPHGHRHWMFLMQSSTMIGPMAIVFMVNFYALVPYLFFRNKRVWYVVSATLLLLLMNFRLIQADVSSFDEMVQTGFYLWVIVSVIVELLATLAAFGLRIFIRSQEIQRQLEEEQRKSTEAELHWLKNQLNPHFLFNALNNISSLTQIDPDEAQEAIAQLSELLRYALYESNKPLVPLAGEVEFMHNYISMMKLRCSSLTTVQADLNVSNPSLQIAPLLFISFVENAFKHGTSANQPSNISIHLSTEGDSIRFVCSNTNLPKSNHDKSGSGVGLDNTRRRLDLLYPNRYRWTQTLDNGIYRIEITIN